MVKNSNATHSESNIGDLAWFHKTITENLEKRDCRARKINMSNKSCSNNDEE